MAKVFTDLPLELLFKITCLLDIVDLLSFFRVNKVLYKISSSYSVWHNLARRYIESHYDSVQPDEGPIETLSVSSLRKWINPRLHVDHLWKNQKLAHPKRWRKPIRKLGCARLVHGGRWLLAGLVTGEVVFYDLVDISLDSKPKVLISDVGPGSFPSPKQSVDLMEISLDHSKSGSSEVILAITGNTISTRSGAQIHVYRVTLHKEEAAEALSAEHINSISSEGCNCIRDIAIAGTRLARSSTFPRSSATIIEVFEWRKQSGTHMVRSVIHLDRSFAHTPFKVLILGETRILVVGPQNIWIYDIPPSSCSNLSEHERKTNPTWSYHIEAGAMQRCIAASQLYHDRQTGHFKIVVSSATAIWGFIIPENSSNHEPHGIQLMDLRHYEHVMPDPSRVMLALGLHKGYACYSNKWGIRFGWDWDRAMALAGLEEHVVQRNVRRHNTHRMNDSENLGYAFSDRDDGYGSYQEILFDEEIGKAVLVRPSVWGPESGASVVEYL